MWRPYGSGYSKGCQRECPCSCCFPTETMACTQAYIIVHLYEQDLNLHYPHSLHFWNDSIGKKKQKSKKGAIIHYVTKFQNSCVTAWTAIHFLNVIPVKTVYFFFYFRFSLHIPQLCVKCSRVSRIKKKKKKTQTGSSSHQRKMGRWGRRQVGPLLHLSPIYAAYHF